MYTSLVLVGLACSSVCLNPALPAVRETYPLSLGLAEGARMDKTFRVRTSAVSTDFRVFMGGQPVPSAYLPQLEFSNEDSITVEFRDTYGKSTDGRLMGFERSYKELAGEGSLSVEVPPQAPEESEWQRESPLVDEMVAFVWDEEAEAYSRELIGGGECPEPLENLQAQTDLAGFLPEEEVATGDSWTVDASLLTGLMNPGGQLSLNRSEEDQGTAFEPLDLQGEFVVTFKRVEREDGVNVATLIIEGECERTAEREGDLSRVPVADGLATDTATWHYDLEGELQWNLDAGHAITLDLSGSFDQMLRTDRDEGQGGAEYASEIESDGDLDIHLQFSLVEDGRD